MRRQRKKMSNREVSPNTTSGREETKKLACKSSRAFSSSLGTELSTRRSQVPMIQCPAYPAIDDSRALAAYITGRPIPFVTCRSTSKSFNLRVNVQAILSLIKKGDRRLARGASEILNATAAHSSSSCQSVCPAMGSRAIDLPSNAEEKWVRSSVTARCLCFPAGQCEAPPLLRRYIAWVSQCEEPLLRRYTEWGYQGDAPPLLPTYTDCRSDSKQNSVQGHVDGLKKDWRIINGLV